MSCILRQSLTNLELDALYRYAKNSNFILEVGTGISTQFLGKAAMESGGEMVTINITDTPLDLHFKGITYLMGYSICQDDMILRGHPQFTLSRYKNTPDESVAFGKIKIRPPCDLIRFACENRKLDFYFGDSGEYCGLAEWNIVKDLLAVDGWIALHDIYYPKSSKNFQVYDAIRKSDNWQIYLKTNTKAGLVIAKKIKEL